jgi:hypothetical protein
MNNIITYCVYLLRVKCIGCYGHPGIGHLITTYSSNVPKKLDKIWDISIKIQDFSQLIKGLKLNPVGDSLLYTWGMGEESSP